VKAISPKLCFQICQLAGFALLLALPGTDEPAGFFLLMFLAIMSLLRWRVPVAKATVLIDLIACAAMASLWSRAPHAMALPLFQAMYLGVYPAALALAILLFRFEPLLAALLALGALCGAFLGLWERERGDKLKLRDSTAGRYYELESLQRDLSTTLAQVERMAAAQERARIARDIHDNAGHEIVAAYISLQTARAMMDGADAGALELYDAALDRLSSGAGKIREAVHNLSTAAFLGVESLRETCARFPACAVDFNAYGDASQIPAHAWTVLESCLNESLTNIARHSAASRATVSLDTTPHIARLCVENDGARPGELAGSGARGGLRNLRHRAAAIGGSLSVDSSGVFRIICVIPLRAPKREGDL